MEDIEKRHLQIADTAQTKISQRLEDLDPKDLQVQHIPKLLEAIVRVQKMVFPATPQTPQVGGIIGATELRLQLKQLGMLTDQVRLRPSMRPELRAWLAGDLDP